MKKRIIIVHGIHTNDKESWMYEWARALSTTGVFEPMVWTYGYAYAFLTRWQNPGRARKLFEIIKEGDILLGHSNGCELIWEAGEYGAPITGAVLLNPALDTDRVMADQVKWINLYPNKHDTVIGFAKFFPKHPWGLQGRDGIKNKDSRYQTYFTDDAGEYSVYG